MDNSRGYHNGLMFLTYLFVAVFILLSMFLAILGEAQFAVREREDEEKKAGTASNPYGMLGEAWDCADTYTPELWCCRVRYGIRARASGVSHVLEAQGS